MQRAFDTYCNWSSEKSRIQDNNFFDIKTVQYTVKEKTKYFSLEAQNNDNWIAVPHGLLGLIAPRQSRSASKE